MKHEEFTVWLSGFLTNRDSLDKKDIETIIKMLGEINKTTPLYDPYTWKPVRELTNPAPVYIPDLPKPPFNPTCETGKQILKDVYGPGNDDYGRNPMMSNTSTEKTSVEKQWDIKSDNPPMMSNGDHSVLPPNFRKKHK